MQPPPSRLSGRIGLALALACLLPAAPAFGQAQPASTPSADDGVSALVKTENAFALRLYHQLAAAHGGNVFFSPHSISSALAMTWAGAHGDTASQMAKALGLDALPAAAVAPAFGQLQQSLNAIDSKSGVSLLVANSLWPQSNHPILPDYLKLVQNDFNAAITPVDYQKQADAAVAHINAWVADKTQQRIKDLLHPGDATPATRLILINAIYFKGNWAEKFDPAQTADAPFTTATGDQTTVPLMHHHLEQAFFADVSSGPVPLQILALPCQNPKLQFVVLLPKSPGDLPVLEQNLAAGLDGWLGRLSGPREVNVALPKFKLDQRYDLVPPLKALGIADAFDDRADFSGMDGARDLCIGGVVHQAFVEVNEQGAEAAAATGVVMRALAVQVVPEFRADHPFLFLIRDTTSGAILFIGRLSNPS